MNDGTLDRQKTELLIRTKGLRKKWIAEEMKIHPKTLYAYLSGRNSPPAAMIKLLAIVIGVSEQDLKKAS